MTKIIIFDFDDTLVGYNMIVPRQTYHMLNKFKKLGYFIGIISYNFMVNIVANDLNLYKYADVIIYENSDRNILFNKCLQFILNKNSLLLDEVSIYYVDDRKDNIDCIVDNFSFVKPYHCINNYSLYKFKYQI